MKKGIHAVLINEDNTKSAGLWAEARTKAQMVYISPEMALSPSFIKLWTNARFRAQVQALIVDEAHCIDEWGEEFRPKYHELEKLRSFMGQEIPFVACTATATTSTFNVIWKSLGFGNRPFWGIDVGCDRPNLLFLTRQLVNSKSAVLDVLNFLPTALDDTTLVDAIPKGLCYYDSEAACSTGVKTWRQALPPHLRNCVYAFFSGISEEAKRQCWEGFMLGQYRIICCTDAAGMGCNIPDVAFTVIFGCPRSLLVVAQRWGRTGRDWKTLGTCLLLVPPWAFRPAPPEVGAAVQHVKGKSKLKIEPKSRTLARSNIEKSLEAFINLGHGLAITDKGMGCTTSRS
jgi:superfamily II DNA helicase RecQ